MSSIAGGWLMGPTPGRLMTCKSQTIFGHHGGQRGTSSIIFSNSVLSRRGMPTAACCMFGRELYGKPPFTLWLNHLPATFISLNGGLVGFLVEDGRRYAGRTFRRRAMRFRSLPGIVNLSLQRRSALAISPRWVRFPHWKRSARTKSGAPSAGHSPLCRARMTVATFS
jgi:hypothetical protein